MVSSFLLSLQITDISPAEPAQRELQLSSTDDLFCAGCHNAITQLQSLDSSSVMTRRIKVQGLGFISLQHTRDVAPLME